MAFDRLYGYPDLYYLAVQICSTIEAVWAGSARKPAEIVPFFAVAAGEAGQSDAEIASRLIALCSTARSPSP